MEDIVFINYHKILECVHFWMGVSLSGYSLVLVKA